MKMSMMLKPSGIFVNTLFTDRCQIDLANRNAKFQIHFKG